VPHSVLLFECDISETDPVTETMSFFLVFFQILIFLSTDPVSQTFFNPLFFLQSVSIHSANVVYE
jgi:hypothetical protein